MKLILVRHGETEENANFIIQGQSDGKLSALGIRQTEELAKQFSKEHFDAIYASDLGRCVKTAEAIHAYHKNTPLLFSKELREFRFGRLEGHKARQMKWLAKIGAIIPKGIFGVEAPKQVKQRVLAYIDQIYEEHKNDKVLVVTHGGPIRIIKLTLENLPFSHALDIEVPNCSIWRFDIDKPI